MNAGDWFAKALKLLYAGASEDALDAFSTAIQVDPEFAEAYAYCGFAYYRQDTYDAAMEDYDKVVEHYERRKSKSSLVIAVGPPFSGDSRSAR